MLSESLKYSLVRFPVAFTAHQHPNLPRAALYHPSTRLEFQSAFMLGVKESRRVTRSKYVFQVLTKKIVAFFRVWNAGWSWCIWHLTLRICTALQSLVYSCNTVRKKRGQTCFGQHVSRPSPPMGLFRCRYSLNGRFCCKTQLIWQLRGPSWVCSTCENV